MTAKLYPHAVQKAARRGVLSAAGAKRVEVVLDARSLAYLENIKAQTGVKTNAEAIFRALYAADALLTPLSSQ
jgi:biotin synthase-related radical SAM superfamily protein